MTNPDASFSVSNSSSILAESPTARSSAPDLAGDLDGVLDELPPLAPEPFGDAI
jgi:hypothetical protein